MLALIFIIPIMFSLQSASFKQFGLKCDSSSGGSAVFSTLYLGISAFFSLIIMLILGGSVSIGSIFYGILFGVIFYFFITIYSMACDEGPLSYTAFIFATSMVIPIVVSFFAFGEKVNALQIVGFVILIVSIYFVSFAGSHSNTMVFSKKWLVLCIVGFFLNAGTMISTKLYAMNVEDGNVVQFLLTAYVVALILSLTRYALPKVRLELRTLSIDKWFIILAIVVGITNVFGNGMLAFLGDKIDAGVLYPVSNGTCIFLSLLFSIIFFKEKLSAKAIFGLSLGVVSIVLLSL